MIGRGQLTLDALKQTTRTHPDLVAQLIPVARELAKGGRGVTVGDVVASAARRGIAVPSRAHCLGHLMERAGLKATDEMRRSPIAKQKGRYQRVWVDGSCSANRT